MKATTADLALTLLEDIVNSFPGLVLDQGEIEAMQDEDEDLDEEVNGGDLVDRISFLLHDVKKNEELLKVLKTAAKGER